MFKTRALMGLLALAPVFAACLSPVDSRSDVELRTSAIGGCPGAGGAVGTSPGIRGFTSANGTHIAVFREVNTSNIIQVSGAPFGNPVTIASDAMSGSTPWGYVRSDGFSAVLYVDTQQHVHEITVSGNLDLFAAAGINAPAAAPAQFAGPVPDVIGYVRSDNRSAIVYRSATNHVIELKSNFGGMGQPAWLVTDLTVASGASVTVGKGSAYPFVRSDSWNTIIYIGSDNHIHHIALLGASLFDEDLSALSGDTGNPDSEPIGVKRSDGYNCVLFVGTDGKMHQLAFLPGGSWWTSNLPATPKGGLHQRPAAYVRPDQTNVVVYTTPSNSIVEIRLSNGQWLPTDLPTNCVKALGQVFGHSAAPLRNSVLFYGASGPNVSRYELFRSNGSPWTLSSF
jgi:hypothetical protein